MNSLHNTGKILASFLSVVFAALLYPNIVEVHGVLKSGFYTLLGVGFIWLVYFLLGSLFKHIHEKGVKEGRDDNSDFV